MSVQAMYCEVSSKLMARASHIWWGQPKNQGLRELRTMRTDQTHGLREPPMVGSAQKSWFARAAYHENRPKLMARASHIWWGQPKNHGSRKLRTMRTDQTHGLREPHMVGSAQKSGFARAVYCENS
jgi:hypothetical protein